MKLSKLGTRPGSEAGLCQRRNRRHTRLKHACGGVTATAGDTAPDALTFGRMSLQLAANEGRSAPKQEGGRWSPHRQKMNFHYS